MTDSRPSTSPALRWLSHVLVGAATTAAVVLSTAGTATAATILPTKDLPSPDSCLTLTWKETGFAWHNQQVVAKNNCNQTHYFHIITGQGIDWMTTPCIAVDPGKTAGWSWTKGRRYNYTESCTP